LFQQHTSKILGTEFSTKDIGWIFTLKRGGWFRLYLTVHGYYKSRFVASRWSKHGLTSLHIPGHDPPLDITVFMDVSPNPGQGISPTNRICSSRSCVDLHMASCQDSTLTYSRNQLFSIRRASICSRVLPESIYTELKNSGLHHYRGNRAGRQFYHRNIQVATFDQRIFHISTVISHHPPRLRTGSRTADFSNLSYFETYAAV